MMVTTMTKRTKKTPQSVASREVIRAARALEKVRDKLDNARYLDGISSAERARMTNCLLEVIRAMSTCNRFMDDAAQEEDERLGDLERTQEFEARHAAMMGR